MKILIGKAVVEQALGALETCETGSWSMTYDEPSVAEAITALREALDPELQFVRDWNDGKVRRVSDGKVMGFAEQAEQEPVACEPVLPIDDDGWSDWICPKPQGYLMQCCDCGLIHEVDSRVAQYEPRPSEDFVVVNDQNMQAQWRMRRRDDLASPQQVERMVFQAREIGESEWFDVGLDETERINAYINSPHIDYRRLYTRPVRTKDLTYAELGELFVKAKEETFGYARVKPEGGISLKPSIEYFARAVIAADREKNNPLTKSNKGE